MAAISLCMIVKNEEDVLARCLESAKPVVDEIVIIDTGSTDRTKEIASQYTSKVYDFTWQDDFSAARNESFARAEKDYCLWLDADDLIPESSLGEWLRLKEQLGKSGYCADVVMAPYHIAFDPADGSPAFSYYRERLLRREAGFQWFGRVHEVIIPSGNIVYTEAAVEHRKEKPRDSDRNLRIYQKVLSEGGGLDARQRYYYARELMEHKAYAEAQKEFLQVLSAESGWIENRLDACRCLAVCLYAQGKEKEALASLLWGLSYDLPRAELCCDLGNHFLKREDWEKAAYWYQQALEARRDDKRGAFILEDCYGYLPCIQLCVCYDRLGNKIKAEEYNEMAGKYKPDSPEYQYNKAYFERAGLKKEEDS